MEASSSAAQNKASAPILEKAPSTPPIKDSEHITSLATEGKPSFPPTLDENGIPLSKNKLKKLKRDREWEANREKRKAKRKEKDREKKARKRAACSSKNLNGTSETFGDPPAAKKLRFDQDENAKPFIGSKERARSTHLQHTQLPITLVLDCGFDDLMKETEIKSLSSQVTRAYSDCHRAPFQAHLLVCSFGGRLRERFEGVLTSNHKSWKGVTFLEEDFAGAAERAAGFMSDGEAGGRTGKMAGAFASSADDGDESTLAKLKAEGEVVYLTSDSENTLTELKPFSTYIIGGIVDKNRHKGVCYKRAMDRGVKTAKLPIGEFMQMQSRFVLATNHVVEIMLRWLECGDWGEAFLRVIPKRKGVSLRAGDGGGGGGLGGERLRDGQAAVDGDEVAMEYRDAFDEDERERDQSEEGGTALPDQITDLEVHGTRERSEYCRCRQWKLGSDVSLEARDTNGG